MDGLTEGAAGPIQQFGFVLGSAIIGGGLSWLTSYLAPKNAG
jgi:hypothetical protein